MTKICINSTNLKGLTRRLDKSHFVGIMNSEGFGLDEVNSLTKKSVNLD